MKRVGDLLGRPDTFGRHRPRHNFNSNDARFILHQLGVSGEGLGRRPEQFEEFLDYLEGSGFAFHGQDVGPELQAHLWAFLYGDHEDETSASAPNQAPPAQITPPVQIAPVAPDPVRAPTRALFEAIKRNDIKQMVDILDQNPPLIAAVSCDESDPFNDPPFPGHLPLTAASALGTSATEALCAWIKGAIEAKVISVDVLDLQNSYGETALTAAILSNAPAQCLQTLLEAGAGEDAPNATGTTPLCLAIRASNPAAVRALLTGGAKIPVILDDPLIEIRKKQRFDPRDSGPDRETDPSPQDNEILVDLLRAAQNDLEAAFNDPALTELDLAEKFLIRWEQCDFFARYCDDDGVQTAAVEAYARLQDHCPGAFEKLFLSDMELAFRVTEQLSEATIQHKDETVGLFAQVRNVALAIESVEGVRDLDLFEILRLGDDGMFRFFRNRRELAIEFLQFLKSRDYFRMTTESDSENSEDEADLATRIDEKAARLYSLFEEFAADLGIKSLPPEPEDEEVFFCARENQPLVMGLLIEGGSNEAIKAELARNWRCLLEAVPMTSSRERIYHIERIVVAYAGNKEAGSKFPERMTTGYYFPRDASVGRTALTYSVVKDKTATGVLLVLCNWVVEERSKPGSEAPSDLLDSLDPLGETALTTAVAEKSPACVELLIRSGANPDAPNTRGRTPLMLAAQAGNEAMVQLLLKHGADVAAYAPSGSTTISLAVAASEGYGPDRAKKRRIVDALLEAAPHKLNELLEQAETHGIGAAGPESKSFRARFASVWTNEVRLWLSLMENPDASVRAAASARLGALRDCGSTACADLFLLDPAKGQEFVAEALRLVKSMSAPKSAEETQAILAIHALVFEQAIFNSELSSLFDLCHDLLWRPIASGHILGLDGTQDEFTVALLRRIESKAKEMLQSGESVVSVNGLGGFMESLGNAPSNRSEEVSQACFDCLVEISHVLVTERQFHALIARLQQDSDAAAAIEMVGREQFIARLILEGVSPSNIEAAEAQLFWLAAQQQDASQT